MATCNTRRFPRQKVCAGDLRHRIEILQRTHLEPEPGESVGRNSFQLIKRSYAAINTSNGLFSGTQRFDGVNVEDRPTHVFTIRYNPSFNLVEFSNYFIRYNSRYFRVLRSPIVNEDMQLIDIQTAERGLDQIESNEA